MEGKHEKEINDIFPDQIDDEMMKDELRAYWSILLLDLRHVDPSVYDKLPYFLEDVALREKVAIFLIEPACLTEAFA